MTMSADSMIQYIPVMSIGNLSVDDSSFSTEFLENLLEGNIGEKIKKSVVDLLRNTPLPPLDNIDSALQQSLGVLETLESFFDFIEKNSIQDLIRQKYGPVMASNFGLAMNTTIAFFRLLKSRLENVTSADAKIDLDLFARVIEGPIFRAYPQDSELPYPSEISIEMDKATREMRQSVIFMLNMAAFWTLIMLTVGLAKYEPGLHPGQIDQIEQLLRDWTLDFLIQVNESLQVKLDVHGPFDISIPTLTEDGALADMGLDDYLERLE